MSVVSLRGSPAHAGMDPSVVHPDRNHSRLPRTRGDGPCITRCVRRTAAAPPHTRGWTLNPSRQASRGPGSPAHAGMDPGLRMHEGRQGRLPRTRGDGPRWTRSNPRRSAAPPHTRGWTRLEHQGTSLAHGSPAHAGMDPRPAGRPRFWRRLPRTRGDGPGLDTGSDALNAAPPHTRGWTPAVGRRRRGSAGSPAHAGMDPPLVLAPPRMRWLPRTRGDGPMPAWAKAKSPQAPPHTRGWTPSRPPSPAPSGGSPAHAGMDPASRSGQPAPHRLPRTRGDGPMCPNSTNGPASAPPHTRGWTGDRGLHARRGDGSPAHAGMDPDQGTGCHRSARLPRTRGDGPLGRALMTAGE